MQIGTRTDMMLRGAITAAALLLTLSCAQQSAETRPTASQTITLTDSLLQCGVSDTLRFGHLYAGETAVKSFVLRNETSSPIVILDTETNCRCTTFDYTRRPVLAGSETVITASFDSRGEWGWQFKLVKFILSGTGVPMRIYIEAEVE